MDLSVGVGAVVRRVRCSGQPGRLVHLCGVGSLGNPLGQPQTPGHDGRLAMFSIGRRLCLWRQAKLAIGDGIEVQGREIAPDIGKVSKPRAHGGVVRAVGGFRKEHRNREL